MSQLTECPADCGARFSVKICNGRGAGECPKCGLLLEQCPVCEAVHDLIGSLDEDVCLECGTTMTALRRVNTGEITIDELVAPTGEGPPYRMPEDWSPSIDYPEDGAPEVVADD